MPNKTFLDKVEMFAGLSQQDLLKLQEIVAERTYRKDEVIFHADDPAKKVARHIISDREDRRCL